MNGVKCNMKNFAQTFIALLRQLKLIGEGWEEGRRKSANLNLI